MGTVRLGSVLLLLLLVAGCTEPRGPAAGRPPAADPAVAVAPRAVVVSNGQVAIGTPVTVGAVAAESPGATQTSRTAGGVSPSAARPTAPRPQAGTRYPTEGWVGYPVPGTRPAPPGQSAAAQTLAQAAPAGGQRDTRGTLALPDPTQTAGPTAVARTAGPTAVAGTAVAATPSPSPSPVPTLRPAYPPGRYPRLTTHSERVIVRDRPHDPAGFYRSDSVIPVPPGLTSGPLGDETLEDAEAATP